MTSREMELRDLITLATGFTEAGHRASIVCFKDHVELPIPSNIPVHIFSENFSDGFLVQLEEGS